MADPVTTGALVANAISAGAAVLAKGALGEAAKDTDQAIKNAVMRWTGDAADLVKLEAKPDSDARKGALAELIDEQPDEVRHDLATLGQALIEALRDEERQRGPIGVDIGRLEAMQVELDCIRATEGTGFRAKEVKTETFRTGEIDTGRSGKS